MPVSMKRSRSRPRTCQMLQRMRGTTCGSQRSVMPSPSARRSNHRSAMRIAIPWSLPRLRAQRPSCHSRRARGRASRGNLAAGLVPIDPAPATVALAKARFRFPMLGLNPITASIGSAIGFGFADFMGGRAALRLGSALSVALVQSVAALFVLTVVLVGHYPIPAGARSLSEPTRRFGRRGGLDPALSRPCCWSHRYRGAVDRRVLDCGAGPCRGAIRDRDRAAGHRRHGSGGRCGRADRPWERRRRCEQTHRHLGGSWGRREVTFGITSLCLGLLEPGTPMAARS